MAETLDEWWDEEIAKEQKAVMSNVVPGWSFPLDVTRDESGQPLNPIRHYGPRMDQLDHAALLKQGPGPIQQDVLVFIAAPEGMEPGVYPLKSRSATCSLPVARAAGTGLVLRTFVPQGAPLEALPIRDGEPPTEEVLLPEGLMIEVYDVEPPMLNGPKAKGRVLDAAVYPAS